MARFQVDIPDAKIAAYLDDYITADPIEKDESGNPTMTASVWVKQRVIDFLISRIEHGKRIKQEAASRATRGDFT